MPVYEKKWKRIARTCQKMILDLKSIRNITISYRLSISSYRHLNITVCRNNICFEKYYVHYRYCRQTIN